jgi:hypothetical protein
MDLPVENSNPSSQNAKLYSQHRRKSTDPKATKSLPQGPILKAIRKNGFQTSFYSLPKTVRYGSFHGPTSKKKFAGAGDSKIPKAPLKQNFID